MLIGDHAYLSPGVVLSGQVTVEADVFLGAGAIVLPGLRIGRAAVVAAGAVVTADVPRARRSWACRPAQPAPEKPDEVARREEGQEVAQVLPGARVDLEQVDEIESQRHHRGRYVAGHAPIPSSSAAPASAWKATSSSPNPTR